MSDTSSHFKIFFRHLIQKSDLRFLNAALMGCQNNLYALNIWIITDKQFQYCTTVAITMLPALLYPATFQACFLIQKYNTVLLHCQIMLCYRICFYIAYILTVSPTCVLIVSGGKELLQFTNVIKTAVRIILLEFRTLVKRAAT